MSEPSDASPLRKFASKFVEVAEVVAAPRMVGHYTVERRLSTRFGRRTSAIPACCAVLVLPFVAFLPEFGFAARELRSPGRNCESLQFLVTATALTPMLGTALIATSFDRAADIALRAKNECLKDWEKKALASSEGQYLERLLRWPHWSEVGQWLLFLAYAAIFLVVLATPAGC